MRQQPRRQQSHGSCSSNRSSSSSVDDEIYNIIPIRNDLADLPYPEVRAAIAGLRAAGDLRKPPSVAWSEGMDLLDWLGAFFGFQRDNVRNQREHLVLLLSNEQMRITPPPPGDTDVLEQSVHRIRRKLLSNYISWCHYLDQKSNVLTSDGRRDFVSDRRLELLYISLYLLVWGEAANLRFVPECLCYIFHHMAKELNRILDVDENSRPFLPFTYGDNENAFLNRVVTPIYQTINAEVESSRNGTAPHFAWRNYDDINEYFWSRRCFDKLKWPIDGRSNFFSDSGTGKKVGKTGFVEQRSFWSVFRSFDRLWVMLVLFFQAALIVAWQGTDYPWQALSRRDVQVLLLTIFITWAALRLLQSLLDAVTQHGLVSKETPLPGVRMLLKTLAASAWTIAFAVLYSSIWSQRNRDQGWSAAANQQLLNFLEIAAAFVLPELISVVLFAVPWLQNFLEKTNWRISRALSWWFQNQTFVGRGLREGIVDDIKYTLFWVVVLTSKFCFSYSLQIRPMVAPTKALLGIKRIDFKWHELLLNTTGVTRFAVGLLWLPVVLIYLMDLQIWYSIFSSFIGALVGLLSHSGEIRNMDQLRLRFRFFASAMHFNLMPEVQHFKGTLWDKVKDFFRRWKLQYGLGRPYQKIEPNQVEVTKFSLIWNEIIANFREEDIISDQEVELMELPPPNNSSVIRWPCFLICNQLLVALNRAKELDTSSDRVLWRKICKNEYRRCAVIEAYESVKHLLLAIVREGTIGRSIIANFFGEIDGAIQGEKFTETFKTSALPNVHSKLITLVELLTAKEKDLKKVANTLQTLYFIAIRDLPRERRTHEGLRQAGLVPRSASSGLHFENAIELPADVAFYRNVRRLQTILTSKDSMHNIPVNVEARRRIAFFSNSLFMDMPRAPQVEKMLALSILTPYHGEDVLYSQIQLQGSPNEDGVSFLFYLQKIYEDEWKNFIERMRRNGMVEEEEIWRGRLMDLRHWASNRGQTLSRTVRGMMYYYKALKMLAFLDSASEMDIGELASVGSMRRSSTGSNSMDSASASSPSSSGVGILFKGHEYGAALLKCTYVVACGTKKASENPHAEKILYMMKNNEALRVAYVDEVSTGRDGMEYYSVLVKYDQQLHKEVEIYRIRLPGPMKLGEGKSEIQNQAIIFTRGDAVQTIDMNQENYFEEALKMRNLLEEFKRNHGIRKPTILGVHSHVFTGPVSSLAWFMSAQETGFATLGQRVLANPLKVRMHYGHPDVFDRLWFMSRGGLSKASRVINTSEDIFAGFNCTLRGGNVTHHEYIQVGKGRDVGLNQMPMFEAKVSTGNGEQVLSRDVYRLGHGLDFFRMLSFFYTTVGFFFNTMMVVLTVYAFVWGRLYLALSGVEGSIMNAVNTSSNAALGTVLNQQFIIQIGLFTTLPMIVENSLQHGFLSAIWDFLNRELRLSSFFYTFSMGTRTHFFGRTILHGRARYGDTGRASVVQHRSFSENYRLYARSHFVKAIELGAILTVYALYSSMDKYTPVYVALTISSWFLVVSWIMVPSVFNPFGFDWSKTVCDFDEFRKWIWYQAGRLTKADQSWETWWYEEQDHLTTTGLWGKLSEIILDLRFFFFQYAIVYQSNNANGSTSITAYLSSWIYVVVALAVYFVIAYARGRYAAQEHIYYRAVQFNAIFLIILVIIILPKYFSQFTFIYLLTNLLAFIPTGWGLISIAQVMRPFLESTVVWDTVVSAARMYDLLFGVIVMAPVALLSWMPGFESLQTRILFNEYLSRGLRVCQMSHHIRRVKTL